MVQSYPKANIGAQCTARDRGESSSQRSMELRLGHVLQERIDQR